MSLLVAFGVTLTAFLLVVAGMAVGAIMGRRSISGSCGGLANDPNASGEPTCSLCSDPDAACRELKSRMESNGDDDVEKSLAYTECKSDGVDTDRDKDAMNASRSG